MESQCVMIVEDELITAMSLENTIKNMGYSVCHVAETAEDAVDYAADHTIDCIIMDISLKGRMDGIEAAAAINRGIPIIYHTAFVDRMTMDRAKATEHVAILEKPVPTSVLQEHITQALTR
jgi:CheY-like chemotaxis protein